MCNSSSGVLVPNRTAPSLLHTFVVDKVLNFPLPFITQVILTYTNKSRVHNVGRILVNEYSMTGLEITAGQRTMSRLIVDLTGQTFVLPVMLTGQNSIVLKMK